MPNFGGGYAMNPAVARSKAASVKPVASATQPPDQQNAPATDDKGIGSAATGYAGPENGPFECGHCVHFDGRGSCNNPQVQQDPEVNGQVEEDGCCNLFSPGRTDEDDQMEEREMTPGSPDESIETGANYNG